jgi:hypothetical protein
MEGTPPAKPLHRSTGLCAYMGDFSQEFTMTKPKTPTTSVSNDGLRYKNKVAGSPFVPGQGLMLHGTTMSCFLCGSHKKFDELENKKLIGKNHKVCKGGCKKS